MKRFFCFLLFGCFLFLVTGCWNPVDHGIQFYYWKTNVSIGEVEQDYFKKLNSKKLYIRFFDVDKQDGQIIPLAKVRSFDANIFDAWYIPVIFITNRTFSEISEEQLHLLVKNISDLTEDIRVKNQLPEITEIQIDCDWTESTKDAYFHFLKILKERTDIPISCTLRLHQIKYSRKTGIPPVAKGYLMCYATSDPTEESVRNSILDIGLMKNYTASIGDYPLDFDIALPIYSWAIVTNHLGKIKLINNVSESDLDTTFFKEKSSHLFDVTSDTFFRGMYLNKGFTVKVETISPQLLYEAKQYLHQKIRRPYDIIYYHLDAPFLTQYGIEDLL